jgi:aryl-alcohol dehydrogenase-like predicted oxidoreductase
LLPAVVADLTKSLEQMPEETLCQAALRFVYSRPFLAAAMPGMFEDETLEENCAGLARHLELSRGERAALDAASRVAAATEGAWLPGHYRWLDERWQG